MGKDTANSPEASQQLTSADMVEVSLLVEGRQIPSESTELFTTHNPASGEPLSRFGGGCAADVDKAVSASTSNVFHWSVAPHPTLCEKEDTVALGGSDREICGPARCAGRAGDGKNLSEFTRFNARLAAEFVRFNAELADKIQGETFTSDSSSTVIQRRIPRGVVAAIVPWNFPTFNVVLKVAPALAAGKQCDSEALGTGVPGSPCFDKPRAEAGLPPGALTVVPGCGNLVGRFLAEHMDVDMITFTGRPR